MDFNVGKLIEEYGFPTLAVGGLVYLVYYVWRWSTEEIDPVLSSAKKSVVSLIDRIRMHDNDLIRLDEKIDTVRKLRGDKIERETRKAKEDINKNGEH
ncbi:MAG: hypothetical protein EBR30_22010 [Cytophagia bacterium]|jgi:hypothetical protein|nr:hypothetical protein [Cytophagia bacterium]